MKRIKVFALPLILLMITGFQFSSKPWDESTPVYDILFHLGEAKPDHYIANITDDKVKMGKEIVLYGKTNGSAYVSKFYVCASCHNSVREDPDLKKIDQEARLNYAVINKLPYLQGSTFWAMVNRETWYNDDYVKKYGDLVVKANKSLEESIQLCATVCSQGRRLEDWELEALKAFYWSLQLKLSDLELSDKELKDILNAYQDTSHAKEIVKMIKSKYLLTSPATFTEAPSDKAKGYDLVGRPEIGKIIYNQACKHCHRPHGESDVVFDDGKNTFKWLNKHKADNDQKSIYQIIRYGTYSDKGHSEYMPLYTLEKMSDQQVEDLRAYIELKSGN